MPRKKPADPHEKPQKERFIEAAKKAGVDESGEEFERAFRRIVPPKRSRRVDRQSDREPPRAKR